MGDGLLCNYIFKHSLRSITKSADDHFTIKLDFGSENPSTAELPAFEKQEWSYEYFAHFY